MSGYLHEVFISYRRNNLIQPWVADFFLETFKLWLNEKLVEFGYNDWVNYPEAKIYFDKINNQPGNAWPQILQDSLKRSKVLVAVFSPTYFTSTWCTSEWESFGHREQIIGQVGLRIPVRYHDCDQYLAGIQWSDFSDLTSVFYRDQQYRNFENKIIELASAVARSIIAAPPYNDTWPTLTIPPTYTSIKLARL